MTDSAESMLPPAVPAKKGGAWKWVAFGCLGVTVLVLLLIGACVTLLLGGKRSIDPTTNAFFAAYEAEDFDAFYAMTSTGFREATSEEEARDFFTGMRANLGKVVSRTMTGINIEANTDGSTAQANYSVTFEKGSGTVTFHLLREAGKWMVHRVDFESDQAESDA